MGRGYNLWQAVQDMESTEHRQGAEQAAHSSVIRESVSIPPQPAARQFSVGHTEEQSKRTLPLLGLFQTRPVDITSAVTRITSAMPISTASLSACPTSRKLGVEMGPM